MIKKICILLVLFSTIIVSSQDITLLKNTHPKAKELKHSLNNTRDSLILGCEKTILKVEIFNEDYEKSVIVEAFKTQISLDDIPVGKFVIQAKLADKIIVIDLIKHNYFNAESNSKMSLEQKELAGGKGMMLDDGLNVIKSSPNHSIDFILTRRKTKKLSNKNQKFYWTETRVNTESASNKTMKLVNQEAVDRMILKNKLEHNSASGKLNELTVWEVYNTTKFMAYQVSNPDFIYSLTSDLFNTSPFYSTINSI